MNILKENIKNITLEILQNSEFFLVDFVWRGNDKNRVIEIYIDGEKNVSANDCAAISRKIDEQLLKLPELGTSYRLEVSSPGVDKPLKFLEQFPKHIGRKFELVYLEGDSKKKLSGKLIGVDGESLNFSLNNNEIMKIDFNKIIKAKVLVSFT